MTDSVKPVAWMYVTEDHDKSVTAVQWPASMLSSGGVTETPLIPAQSVEALVSALRKIAPIRVEDGPDYAELFFADGSTHSTQAMTMNPQDWLDISAALAAFGEEG